MESLWQNSCDLPPFPKAEGEQKTEVLIIGGGIVGVLCAYFLEQAGVPYLLVEADRIGRGVTGNTTAKITAQHGLLYHKLINQLGKEKAELYLKANLEAVDQFRQISKKANCDFEEKDAYVYALDQRKNIEKEMQALDQLGYTAEFTDSLPLPFPVAGAVRFRRQAQFHPLKFLAHISKGLHIYEHTPVRELVGTTALTDQGKISAEKIIVATHFPFINKHGSYFLKMYQDRSYVIALENARQVDGMYIDEQEHGLSFRNYRDLLLVGGGGHRTGKKGGNWAELRRFAAEYFPKAKEVYRFATQDCITLDGVPYIGRYSARTHQLYVATGFNKWGMTSSMVSAMILSDMVTGRKNDYAEVFSPSRSILHMKLVSNAFEATAGLFSLTTKRCPHLGCGLKWNRAEHSWDCPCHGSRFDEKGRLLDNPATGDLKKDK